ncbi:sulfotransferase family protein [Actinomadura welshii]
MSSGPDPRHDRPIFVLGCPRSGTTLLQLMLHSHARIAIPAETKIVIPAYARRCEFGDLEERENRRALAEWITTTKTTKFHALGLDPAEVADEIAAGPPTLGSALGIVFRAYARRHGKPRWGDKRPSYSRHVGTLLRMFPDAQFVHLIRDGRDCVASLMEMPWYDKDLYHAVSAWRESIDRGRRLAERLGPDAYYEMQYERLVADPTDELTRLCGFLGEDFDPAMTRPEGIARQTVSPRKKWHGRTRDGVTTNRVGSWAERLDAWQISLAEAAFGERLAEYGYEPSGLPRPPASQLARFTRTSAHRRLAQRKAALRERWKQHHEPNQVRCLLAPEPAVAAAARAEPAESTRAESVQGG